MTDAETKPRSPILSVRVAFLVGDVVYHRASPDGQAGIVNGHMVRPCGVVYMIGWGDRGESNHYEVELTSERPAFQP